MPNWSDYQVVFLGYPIWWGEAAWPLEEFVKNNDFTGKTIIPFCTSSSSSLGDSSINLAALAGSGNWQVGKRFFQNVAPEEAIAWTKTLGL